MSTTTTATATATATATTTETIHGYFDKLPKEKIPDISTSKLKKMIFKALTENNRYTTYKDRLDVVNGIYAVYGDRISQAYDYYSTGNLKAYANSGALFDITNIQNALNDFLLTAKTNLPKTEHNFYTDRDLKTKFHRKEILDEACFYKDAIKLYNNNNLGANNNSSVDGDSVENKNINFTKIYSDYNYASYTVKQIKKEMADNPFIKAYLDYMKLSREIIENNGIVNGEKKYTKSQIRTLKYATGYRPSNSIELNADIITVYKELKNFIYFKTPLRETSDINWDLVFDIEEGNHKHILAILRLGKKDTYDFKNDLHCIIYDLDVLIEKIELNTLEWDILELYRSGDNIPAIQRRYCVEYSFVYNRLKKICRKIIKQYWDDMYDFIYTFKMRGRYKQCNICGMIKIINDDRYYTRCKAFKDGYMYICKICNSNYVMNFKKKEKKDKNEKK